MINFYITLGCLLREHQHYAEPIMYAKPSEQDISKLQPCKPKIIQRSRHYGMSALAILGYRDL